MRTSTNQFLINISWDFIRKMIITVTSRPSVQPSPFSHCKAFFSIFNDNKVNTILILEFGGKGGAKYFKMHPTNRIHLLKLKFLFKIRILILSNVYLFALQRRQCPAKYQNFAQLSCFLFCFMYIFPLFCVLIWFKLRCRFVIKMHSFWLHSRIILSY